MNILYFLCNFLLSFFIFLKGTQILGFLKAKEYDSLSGYSSPDLEPGTKRWIRAQDIYGDALRKCGAGLMLLNVVGALSVFMLELPVIQIESVILLLLEILSFFGAKLWTRNQMAKDIVLTPSAPATPAGETAPADEGSNRSDASLEHADDAKSEEHKAEDENPDESPKETPAKAEETFTDDTQDDAIPAERDDEKESVSEQEELEPDAAANEPDAAAQTEQPREASVPTDTNENEPAELVLPAEDAHIHLAPSSSSADTQATSSEPTASSPSSAPSESAASSIERKAAPSPERRTAPAHEESSSEESGLEDVDPKEADRLARSILKASASRNDRASFHRRDRRSQQIAENGFQVHQIQNNSDQASFSIKRLPEDTDTESK